MSSLSGALARLKRAAFLRETGVRTVFGVLDGAKGRTRAVGGAVRDTLLGRGGDELEVDFATELLPEEVVARAERAGLASVPTGIDHGTVTLVVAGRGYEVTSLREDVETDGRHARVVFGHDWRADAQRRDFTLNALYCGPDGALFDPLEGLGDCLGQKVRFIGDPVQRIAEDRLRVYRFFRFSAAVGGQTFDRAGLRAVAGAAGTLGLLSAERVGGEMVKLLDLPRVYKTLLTMVQCAVLDLPGPVLDQLALYEEKSRRPIAAGRLALLSGVQPLAGWQARWRLSKALIGRADDISAAAELLQHGQVNRAVYTHSEVLDVALGVAAARGNWSAHWQADIARMLAATHPPPFPLRGGDLVAIGIPAGPRVGLTLSRLETAWIDSGFTLGRADLLARAAKALD